MKSERRPLETGGARILGRKIAACDGTAWVNDPTLGGYMKPPSVETALREGASAVESLDDRFDDARESAPWHPASSASPSPGWERTLERLRLRDHARRLWAQDWIDEDVDRAKARIKQVEARLDKADKKRVRPLTEEERNFRLREFERERMCGVALTSSTGAVAIRRKDGRAAMQGTQSCGKVWTCPTCAARIRERRRTELQSLVDRGTAQGLRWVLLTATLRHSSREEHPLAMQRKALEKAWRALTSGKKSQQRRESGLIVGHVRAWDATLGGHSGDHLHVHALLAIGADASDSEIDCASREMRSTWQRWCAKHMGGAMPDEEHGWRWEMARNGGDAADYVAKLAQVDGEGWTVAHELARSDTKRSRVSGSRAPFELMTAAVAAIRETGATDLWEQWIDWARAMRGARALVVSNSLSERLGPLSALTDEEIAEEPETLDDWELVAIMGPIEWRAAARAHGVARILEASARDGADGLSRLLAGVRGDPRQDAGKIAAASKP